MDNDSAGSCPFHERLAPLVADGIGPESSSTRIHVSTKERGTTTKRHGGRSSPVYIWQMGRAKTKADFVGSLSILDAGQHSSGAQAQEFRARHLRVQNPECDFEDDRIEFRTSIQRRVKFQRATRWIVTIPFGPPESTETLGASEKTRGLGLCLSPARHSGREVRTPDAALTNGKEPRKMELLL